MTTDRTLYLPLKRIYFEQIRDGIKVFEYRLCNAHWTRRLVDKTYTHVEFTLGYPPATWADCRVRRLFVGYELQTITHEHFGDKPVEVFAIKVSPI